MSIRERQIKNAMRDIVRKELQSGVYPTASLIQYRLQQQFAKTPPGFPSMQLRYWGHRETSDPKEFNQLQQEIYQDLSDLYAENAEQGLQLLQGFDFAEVERSRLNHRMRKLEERIKEMLLRVSTPNGYTSSFYDTFDDYSNIDLHHTSANINLQEGYIQLPSGTQAEQKVNLETANISFQYVTDPISIKDNIIKDANITPLDYVKNDYTNTIWMREIEYTDPGALRFISGGLDIVFPETTKLNSVAIALETSIPIEIDLLYADNNMDDLKRVPHTGSRKIINNTTWIFPEISTRKLRIRMTKYMPDKILSNGNGITIFGIKTIGIQNNAYAQSGQVISKPYPIPSNSRKVSLFTEEQVPPETSIKYFVGFNQPKIENIHWTPIQPSSEGSSDLIELQPSMEKSLGITIDKNSSKKETKHGITFYPNTSLTGKAINKHSIQVYSGHNQWIRRYGQIDMSKIQGSITNHAPNRNDWLVAEKNADSSYVELLSGSIPLSGIPVESRKIGSVYLYSTYVYAEKPEAIVGTSNITISNCNALVLLNGHKIYEGMHGESNSMSDFILKRGWNSLEILLLQVNDNDISFLVPFQAHTLKEKGIHVAKKTPLTMVDPFVLKESTGANDKHRFALDKDNTLWFNRYHSNESLLVKYSELTNLENNQLVFKAELSRLPTATDRSPILHSYRLRVI